MIYKHLEQIFGIHLIYIFVKLNSMSVTIIIINFYVYLCISSGYSKYTVPLTERGRAIL